MFSGHSGPMVEHRRRALSSQKFTPECKEAVRQVVGRGYSVSTHSLYKWVKAVTPDKIEAGYRPA